jgi:hypothetical protein
MPEAGLRKKAKLREAENFGRCAEVDKNPKREVVTST